MEQSKSTIAVIAPENLYRRALHCVLSSNGYAVETFRIAGDFVSEAGLGEYDCVVIDIDIADSSLLARAHVDFAACLRLELPVILVAPKSSRVPGQLGLAAISKCSEDSALLAVVHQSLGRGR